ncbi:hypothetical protein C4J81_00630 [Deltaproteobacteria bacterium Smac51]|nr:hypothetical protein C4J81_00630 [Deltaproteobacteria bacterium Smac51]
MTDRRDERRDIPRLESAAKVTGRGRYTDDYVPEGLIYGAVLHSPHPHARVLSIDVAPALALPGVLAALAPEEVADIRYNSSGNPPSPLLLKDELILTAHPLFEGDRVAAVAALSPDLCRQALEHIRIEYEVLPPVMTVEAAMAAEAVPMHPELGQGNDFSLLSFDKGDVDEGFKHCDIVIEDVFATPAVHPFPLEPTGCVCEWCDDGITIFSTSQTMFQERRLLAEMFNLPETKVRIVKPFMGGGFGARQQLHYQPVGCLLARKTGRPVKMILTREEEMQATTVRHASKMKLRLGANLDGRLVAFEAEVWQDAGAYCTHSPIVTAAQGKKSPYRFEHYRFRGHCVYTNKVTAGAMRGYGNPQLTFGREMLVDRLARQLNMDPVELRLKNHLRAGEEVPGTGTLVTSCEIEASVAKAMQIKESVDRKRHGEAVWGTAFCMHTSGPSNKSGLSSASIYLNRDGSIQLNLGTADIGQGSETALAQVAAETLHLPLSRVSVHAGDTRSTPYDTGTFASSQMFVGGNAVVMAARDVINNLTCALAETRGVDSDEVTFEAGLFKIGSEHLTMSQAAELVLYGTPGRVIIGEGSFKATEAPPVFAVCLVRVCLDKISGALTITDIAEVVDIGTVVNPNIVRGQIEGGVVQGLGYGWMEQLEIERRTGKNITSDGLLYKVPTPMDLPRLHAATVPGYDPFGPLGAKSVGELTLVPVAAALAIGAERATGESVNKLPLSNQFLLDANGE